MKDKKWMEETDLTRLVLKLNEEVGEVTHAFMRGQMGQVRDECDDVALIAERIREVAR